MNKRVKSNSIRIISGEWRGRKLDVLDAEGLRPTTDRVRETLFNWLMYEVNGAYCLDLFAGTGVLGFECLSRGAEFVQFVELKANTASAIDSGLSSFGVNGHRSNVVTTSFESYLSRPPAKPYDIVFLDPPFADGLLSKAIDLLSQPGWLSEGAFIYIEQSSKQPFVEAPEHWYLYREGKAGQSRYKLYSLNER